MSSQTKRPNILWVLAEDTGPQFGVYGNPDVNTPRLDRLAADGRLYTNAFSTAPVCSPSRSALITGLYQTSIGAHHHRSHRHDGYRLPEGVLLVPERLRSAGYFCANPTRFPDPDLRVSPKQDWNFTAPEHVWDSHDWADLSPNQPFFAMINMAQTHRPYTSGSGPAIEPQALQSLPPYVADRPETRADWAAYLENVQLLDRNVGRILDHLAQDGLAQNTVVFFFADHGPEDFRAKSTAFAGGFRVPLIVRWPDHIPSGEQSDELVSLLDISAATLVLAGVSPDGLHGQDFLDPTTPPRDVIVTARDRIEESVDRVRTVFDGRYRYIRNFMPDQPHYIDRPYYDRTNPVRALMRQLYEAGQLTDNQARVFAQRRPAEELYDMAADPHELTNIAHAHDPDAREALERLRAALDLWIVATDDMGGEPEDPEAMDLGGGPSGRKGQREKQAGQSQGGKRATGRSTASNTGTPTAGEQTAAVPIPVTAADPLVLSAAGQFFVNGRTVPSSGSRRSGAEESTIIEQAPVRYLIPYEQTQALPVVMLPGHGLTSYLYLGTPDGREGWATIFARHGYCVYVMDMPNYGVSGIDARPFDAVRAGAADPATLPGLSVWSNETAWRTWGFGPEPGVPFTDTKYPVAYVDQLYASFTPATGGGGGGKSGAASLDASRAAGGKRPRGAATQSSQPGSGRPKGGDRFGAETASRALLELLDVVGPSVIVAHSAAGATVVNTVRQNPDRVGAVVLVEPAGNPGDPEEVRELFADIPYFAVFGDHFDTRGMQGRYESCVATVDALWAIGGRAEVLRLPDHAIHGNSHLLMQDSNNREIAERIISWLAG